MKPARPQCSRLAGGEGGEARIGALAALDFGLQFGIAPGQLAAEPADLQMRLHARDHLLGAEGLQDVIDRAGRKAAHQAGRIVPRGDEDHRHVGVRFFQLRADAVAILPRHHDIEQDERRPGARREFHGFGAVACRDDLVAERLQRFAQQGEVRRGVVHGEDALGFMRLRIPQQWECATGICATSRWIEAMS